MAERESAKKKRKDRILNTRISEELERELKAEADRLDMPVSQLVRRILRSTVDLVGNFSGNVEHLVTNVVEDVVSIRDAAVPAARRAMGSADALAAIPDSVIGWQPITVQRRTRCAVTGEPLEPGVAAHVSVRTDGGSALVVSDTGLDRVLNPPTEQWTELRVAQPVVCTRSGVEIAAGELAWMRVGSVPPEIICEAEHRRL